jgi:hypothetical protein
MLLKKWNDKKGSEDQSLPFFVGQGHAICKTLLIL